MGLAPGNQRLRYGDRRQFLGRARRCARSIAEADFPIEACRASFAFLVFDPRAVPDTRDHQLAQRPCGLRYRGLSRILRSLAGRAWSKKPVLDVDIRGYV